MAGPLAVPPPPPGGPQPAQKTSEPRNQLFKLPKPETNVTSLDFDSTGEYLLAACSDDSLQLYSATSGTHLKTLLSQKYGAHLARFTHHSQSILYASTKIDDTIRYLSTHDNQFLRYFKGHTAPVTTLTLSPASDTFLSCSLDNTVRLWSLSSPNPQARLNLSTPYLAAYDPSATVIAIASASTSSILLYDLRNYDKPPFATFDMRRAAAESASSSSQHSASAISREWTKLEFSNDGKSLLVATNTASGHLLLDAFSGDLKAFCTRPNVPTNLRAAPGSPGIPGQGDVCFSADGRYLVGGSGGERDALVWDAQGQVNAEQELLPMAGLPWRGKTAVVEWNPRYNMLATADREVVFWLPDEQVAVKPP
ncbi:member of Set1p complex, histone methyl transferase [Toensbergia leucococca]|nr:member of Set1p complex, histone methyl transferase [Toensbergia leucococca]